MIERLLTDGSAAPSATAGDALDGPFPSLRSPLVSSGLAGCHGPADPANAEGASVARPGISSARFRARAVFYHQAKVIVVLEAVAAFESKGCQRDVIHLLCPLVGIAVARGCPAMRLLE